MSHVARASDAFRHLYGGRNNPQLFVSNVLLEAAQVLSSGEAGTDGLNPCAESFVLMGVGQSLEDFYGPCGGFCQYGTVEQQEINDEVLAVLSERRLELSCSDGTLSGPQVPGTVRRRVRSRTRRKLALARKNRTAHECRAARERSFWDSTSESSCDDPHFRLAEPQMCPSLSSCCAAEMASSSSGSMPPLVLSDCWEFGGSWHDSDDGSFTCEHVEAVDAVDMRDEAQEQSRLMWLEARWSVADVRYNEGLVCSANELFPLGGGGPVPISDW